MEIMFKILCETSRTFRKKKGDYLKAELMSLKLIKETKKN
jgi:hypothetical protein